MHETPVLVILVLATTRTTVQRTLRSDPNVNSSKYILLGALQHAD
jgi:hypothetical protein